MAQPEGSHGQGRPFRPGRQSVRDRLGGGGFRERPASRVTVRAYFARTELVPAERNTNVHSDSKPQQASHRPIQPKFPNGGRDGMDCQGGASEETETVRAAVASPPRASQFRQSAPVTSTDALKRPEIHRWHNIRVASVQIASRSVRSERSTPIAKKQPSCGP